MNKITTLRVSIDVYVSPSVDVVIIESNRSILVESGEYSDYDAPGNPGEENDYGTL